MRTIAIANQKGGCGKTTVSVNLSASLAFLGKKVLLIDLDPQAHSTIGLGVKTEEVLRSAYDLFEDAPDAASGIREIRMALSENLHLVPSEVILSAVEQKLAGAPERENRLFRKVEQLEGEYDFVLIDCPPNLGLLTFNALRAANELLIPVECSYFSLHGLTKIQETVKLLEEALNHRLKVRAVLNDFDGRTRFSQKVQEELGRLFPRQLFKTVIHHSVRLKEAASLGKPISEYDRHSVVFQDFLGLSAEVIEQESAVKAPEAVDPFGIPQAIEVANPMTPVEGHEGAHPVLFTMKATEARTVEVAGDFNHWVPEGLLRPIKADGMWRKLYHLPEGTYRYKFLVDGEWMCDSQNPQMELNAYGVFDSVLSVGIRETVYG